MLNKLILIAGLDSDDMQKFANEKYYDFDDAWILNFPENSRHPLKVTSDLKFYIENETNLIICSHADYVWSYICLSILQKTINIENFEIWWINENPIQVKTDKFGRIISPIKGLFDTDLSILADISDLTLTIDY